jgi:Dual specificity phosphatase, catalytic domain.
MVAMQEKGISWFGCGVSEDDGDDWFDALKMALRIMFTAYMSGMKMIVHCDFGNNRSRTFVEAFYYVLKGEQFPDEYKGEFNHLIYNCKIGHLSPVEQTEAFFGLFKARPYRGATEKGKVIGTCPKCPTPLVGRDTGRGNGLAQAILIFGPMNPHERGSSHTILKVQTKSISPA